MADLSLREHQRGCQAPPHMKRKGFSNRFRRCLAPALPHRPWPSARFAGTELAERMTWSAIAFRGAGSLITSLMAAPAASRASLWAARPGLAIALRMVTSGSFMLPLTSRWPAHVKGAERQWSTGPLDRPALGEGGPFTWAGHRLRSQPNDPE